MEKARMTRHVENTFNHIGNAELRRAVYDYTSACMGTTFPERDAIVFSRENQLTPFNTIQDKVTTVINFLKMYWHGLDKQWTTILDVVKQESLLGQAIYLIARSNVDNNDIEMTFNVDLQEIPVVFGDLMILYAQSGYDVSNLKGFLVELYDEYYPKVYPPEKDQSTDEDEESNNGFCITEDDLDVYIRQNLFDFLEHLILEYRKDFLLTRFLYHTPDREELRKNIDCSKDQWLKGINDLIADEIMLHFDQSGDNIKYYPIIDTSIIFKMARQKNKEIESMLQEQLEGITSKAIRECKLFPGEKTLKDTIINKMHWRRAILEKTDTLMIELMIHHSDEIPVPKEFRANDNGKIDVINGSIVLLRVSIIAK